MMYCEEFGLYPKETKDWDNTTEVVSYPEIVHIGEDKDFTPVIEKALELGGYAEDTQFTGINGGETVILSGFWASSARTEMSTKRALGRNGRPERSIGKIPRRSFGSSTRVPLRRIL